jgi:hypothetical protein
VLRKRHHNLFGSRPYFYALSENYGSPEEDYLIQYQQGRLTQEARSIYEALLDKGSLDAVALRRATRMASPESDARFNRALTELQADFKVLPVGVTQAGAWRYAFAYDLVTRHFPTCPSRRAHPGKPGPPGAGPPVLPLGGRRPAGRPGQAIRMDAGAASHALTDLAERGEVRTGLAIGDGPASGWHSPK